MDKKEKKKTTPKLSTFMPKNEKEKKKKDSEQKAKSAERACFLVSEKRNV
jgi:hypothetical protein